MRTRLSATRCLLGTLALGAGLTAHAQTVTLGTNVTLTNLGTAAAATAAQVIPGGNQGFACVPYSLASPQTNLQTFVFTPGANKEVIDRWTLQGDGVATTGTTGTTFSFAPTGFGKARVTVGYYYNNGTIPVFCQGGTVPILCNGVQLTTPVRAYTTRTYEFFKTFTPAQGGYGISGPTCVPAVNDNVVYSINLPVVSTAAQALANIGTDTYLWVVKNAAGTTLSSPANYTIADGNGFITVKNNAFNNQSNFTVEVKAGKCNFGNPGFTLPVVVAPDLNTAFNIFPPACLAVGATTSSFIFNTVLNTTYSLGTTVGLMSTTAIPTPAANISITGTGSPVTVTLSSIPTAGSGAVTIVGVGATGVCFGTQTVIKQVNRLLVSAQNIIAPTCFTSGAPTPLTMTNAPAGVTYSVPAGSGWLIATNANGTATVTAGAAGTSVAVTATTACGSISQTIRAAGEVTGCDYTPSPISNVVQPHQYTAVAVAGNTCTLPGNFYTWTLLNPASTPPNQVLEASARTADNGTVASRIYQFLNVPGPWPNYTVRLRVENSGGCLDILRTVTNQVSQRAAAGGAATGSALKTAAQAALDQVRVYPNPSSDVVTIELPAAAKGAAQVEIVDVLGRVQRTLTTTGQQTPVSVAKLPAGTYTVRVALPDGSRTNRTVVVSH